MMPQWSAWRNPVFLIMIGRAPDEVRRLTAIERRVVRLIALGCDDAHIAVILRRPAPEMRHHAARVMRKTRMKSPSALIRWAREHGVSPPSDRLSVMERIVVRQFRG